MLDVFLGQRLATATCLWTTTLVSHTVDEAVDTGFINALNFFLGPVFVDGTKCVHAAGFLLADEIVDLVLLLRSELHRHGECKEQKAMASRILMETYTPPSW